jgi:outer membrane protein TolC
MNSFSPWLQKQNPMRNFFLFLSLACAPLLAQTSVAPGLDTDQAASAPWIGTKAYFRKVFSTPSAKVELLAPARLKDFVLDGKLTLSLKSYLDLVMANSTDIGIQRLMLESPKNAIQRAFGVFDPTITTSFSAQSSTTPASSQLEGASVVKNLNQPFNLNFQQTLDTGTQVNTSLSWTKTSNNNSFQLFNPSYQNVWQMGFSQPLLRNRGRYVNRLPITIARAQKQSSDFGFEDQLMRLLVNAENSYWDVINQRERLKVQTEALALAEKMLERTRLEIKLGATSELEVFQPEQNAAQAKISVSQVQYQLLQAEDALRRQMGVDLDPDVRKLPIVLTEPVEPTIDEQPIDAEAMVGAAVQRRPDLKASRTNIEVNDLQIQSTKNMLKPSFTLNGFYRTFGRGGPGVLRGVGGAPNIIVPGGPGDAWSMMFGFDYPVYQLGLNLNLPLRDRAAAANFSDSVVNKRLNTLRARQNEQQVRLDVLQAVSQVESSKASVKLAKIALDYSLKRLEADQKRYDLGVINIFFLLSSQNDLTTAQSNVVNATVTYRRNVLNLLQRSATLLENRGIKPE